MTEINCLFSGVKRLVTHVCSSESETTQLPKQVTAIVLIVCTLPFCLNLLGFDFGSPRPGIDIESLMGLKRSQITDVLHYTLSGSFTHTILEWSAFCTAIFTVILALASGLARGKDLKLRYL